jgi:hypothetical protein
MEILKDVVYDFLWHSVVSQLLNANFYGKYYIYLHLFI